MKHLNLPSVRQIQTNSETVYAFEVTGDVSKDEFILSTAASIRLASNAKP